VQNPHWSPCISRNASCRDGAAPRRRRAPRRRDLRTVCLHREQQARPHRGAIEQHRAGPQTPCSQPTWVPVRPSGGGGSQRGAGAAAALGVVAAVDVDRNRNLGGVTSSRTVPAGAFDGEPERTPVRVPARRRRYSAVPWMSLAGWIVCLTASAHLRAPRRCRGAPRAAARRLGRASGTADAGEGEPCLGDRLVSERDRGGDANERVVAVAPRELEPRVPVRAVRRNQISVRISVDARVVVEITPVELLRCQRPAALGTAHGDAASRQTATAGSSAAGRRERGSRRSSPVSDLEVADPGHRVGQERNLARDERALLYGRCRVIAPMATPASRSLMYASSLTRLRSISRRAWRAAY